VKRLSASVCSITSSDRAPGVEAPAPERLRAIKDLVSATVGVQQNGDRSLSRRCHSRRRATFLLARHRRHGAPASPPVANTIPGWLRVPRGHLNWLIERAEPDIIALLLGVLYRLYRILRGVGRKATCLIAGATSKLPFLKRKRPAYRCHDGPA
jgi:hypothetical protein